MAERTSIIASIISLVGTLLILVNTILVAASGSPLILSSYPVSSVDALFIPGARLWVSVAFGFRGLVEGPLTLLWIVLACLSFFLATSWYLAPERPENKSLLVLIFSLLSIFTGGGFIVGLILGVAGGCIGLQHRLSLKETFIVKYLRALRFDKSLFNGLKEENAAGAAWVIMLISVLSGLGTSIYMNSINEIHSSSDAASKILLLGVHSWNNSVLSAAFINIGIGVFKWLFLSLLLFLIGTKLAGGKADFGAVASIIAYAYAPIALQIFLPVLNFSEPFLSSNWPMTVFFITNLWMILVLVIAAGRLFELPTTKAAGLVMLVGTFYWIAIYKAILPAVRITEPTFEAPGIFFEIQPLNVVFALMSLSITLSVLLGVFSKRK